MARLAIGYGKRTWRGRQFSLALFPLWIRATWTAVANVVFHRPLGFVVLPKTKQEQAGPPWRLAPCSNWRFRWSTSD